MRPLKIGIVCPYSFDAPGGVQFHIRDLAQELINRGHSVEVLAPASEDTEVPEYLTSAGKAVQVKYNGSVARLTFGPRAARKVGRWLKEGEFDILHLHEPVTPSLSLLALWNANAPVVATFHTSQVRSRAMQFAQPIVRQQLEKIDARIAVSEDARRTLIDHLGGDAIVIPNGVYVDYFQNAEVSEKWVGKPQSPTISFLGRLDEPRKGLQILTKAIKTVTERYPDAKFFIAGNGAEGKASALKELGTLSKNVEFLGGISDEEKASLLKSTDLYIAPQTGGESFGIVLVEAMSAGTCVVASNLGAFQRVLNDGKSGFLFKNGDSQDLARTIIFALENPQTCEKKKKDANLMVNRFDWHTVTTQIETVYDTVLEGRLALKSTVQSNVTGGEN